MSQLPTVEEFWNKTKEDITGHLGGIYEHSSWVAETLYAEYGASGSRANEELKTVGDIHRAMKAIVDASSTDQKLELLKAHPDLCEKINQSQLTKASQEEQRRAGLESLTDEERTQFHTLNQRYRNKFGFPFILAVRNATKYTVLSAIEGRVDGQYDAEFAAALSQVHKIAWMRLLSSFTISNRKGFLTCHVLDTANGCPAANMRVRLERVSPKDTSNCTGDDYYKEFVTNDDGRLPGGPALKGDDFQVGTYQWTFFVGDYFARKNTPTSGTPFLNEVPIVFGIDDPDEHYHVPLLVSPWSFSTYRGS